MFPAIALLGTTMMGFCYISVSLEEDIISSSSDLDYLPGLGLAYASPLLATKFRIFLKDTGPCSRESLVQRGLS